MHGESPIKRRVSRKIWVGSVPVGGDAPIAVQSMTNTDTNDVAATVAQVQRLQDAGADIVLASDLPRSAGMSSSSAMMIALFLALAPFSEQLSAVAEAAILITIVGALDDRFDLLPGVKLVGQIAAAVVVVRGGMVVDNVTIPFIGPIVFGSAADSTAAIA